MIVDLVCPECSKPFRAERNKNRLRTYCDNRCAAAAGNRRHGATNTREYKSWEQMRERCNNTRHHAYARYGGRGIKVCDRWSIFEAFLDDMGPRPENYSIERVDNDGNYEPGNCRWASKLEQSRNRRGTFTAAEDQAIRDGAARRLSWRQIALLMGKSHGSISCRARRIGVRSNWDPNKPRTAPPVLGCRQMER